MRRTARVVVVGSRVALAIAVTLASCAWSTNARASSSDELLREARAHEAAHEDDLALRRYTEALSLDASCGPCYLGLAALRARLGDVREAERVYSVGLAHVPDMHDGLLGRARMRRALGWREEAVRDVETYAAQTGDAGALREVARWQGEDGHTPAQLATWRRILALATRQGDASLANEARTLVRALQILVRPADPASAPVDPDATRRALSAIARRAGG